MVVRAMCSKSGVRVALVILLLFSGLKAGFAQHSEYYPHHEPDSAKILKLAAAQKLSLEKYFTVPAGVSSDYRKSYIEIFKQSAAETYRRVKNSALLDTIADPFVQAVFEEVKRVNKDLPATRLILTRNPLENAYAQADGTVFFNIGLLAKLENEGQVAFVICHELAHIKLKHMERGIKEVLDVVHSKEYKKQFKQVAREKYNKHSKMETFFEGLSLNNLYHKRSLETQADSLGFVMYAKTKYAIEDAFSTLLVLDKIDEPYTAGLTDLNKYFGCTTFNPDQGKATASSSIFSVAPKKPEFAENPDTLKSHPDCLIRMQYLRDLSESRKDVLKPGNYNTAKMSKIKDISRREVVQSWFDAKDYDYAFYNALQLLETDPESNYLKQMVVASLAGMKQYMQQHRYPEVVSIAHRNSHESLNHILNFLNNLNTSDFKKAGTCFNENFALKNNTADNEYDLVQSYAQAVLQDDTQAANAAKSSYLRTYKKGRFSRTLFRD